MAAYAAHLTRTLQGTPSLFQVTAQEALGATVKPAIRKFIEYLATVYPNKCGWCVKWFDELYLLFDCCLQYHYLKHYAASFSERFYGLLRVPITASEFHSGQRLPVTLEQGSLALLVLVPYLKDKLEALVERWRADDDDGLLGKSKSDRARRAAIHIYSTVHLVTSAARLAQLARYLTGRSRCHSPALAALQLVLQDAPARDEGGGWGDWLDSLKMGDYEMMRDCSTIHHTLQVQLARYLTGRSRAHSPALAALQLVLQDAPARDEGGGWRDWLDTLKMGDYESAMITFPMLGQLGLRAVEYGAFAVQFLRWWESRAMDATAALPTPPPPAKDEKAIRMKNKCPICLQSWKIPTVLPVSGYIFCYVCISRHVRSHGACPASRLPAAERDLVRLYLDT